MPVRHALLADRTALERALADAFIDDPMTSWVMGEDDRQRRHEMLVAGFFGPAFAAGLRRGHTYVATDTAGAITGGAIWSPPDVEILDEPEGVAFGTALFEHAGPDAVARISALSDLVDALHPKARPHFYLFIVGAAVQGTGVGLQLLAPVIARCDADGLPAYLESSNARNIGFYERHGFQVAWEQAPELGGPIMHGMWREPVDRD